MSSTKTASHTAIYASGQVIRNIVSFVMLPIYTRCLTTSDYGVVELLSMISDFFGILFCNQLGQAIFRYYSEADSARSKSNVIRTSLVLGFGLNSFGFLIITLLRYPLSEIAFGNTDRVQQVALFSLGLVTLSMVELPLTYLRAAQRPWFFLYASLAKLIIQVGCNLYFVVYLRLHVDGVIYSSLLSSLLVGLVLVVVCFREIKPSSFDTKLAKDMFWFSLPISVATLGSFYLTFGDRYFLRVFFGESEVGVYTLAYKFGALLFFLAWSPFSNVWDIQRYEVAKRSDATQVFGKVFYYQNLFMLALALGIALLVPEVLQIMSHSDFWRAASVTPIILISYVILVWANFTSFGIMYSKKSQHMFYAEVCAVILVSIGYLTLIPRWGAVGAAWATVLGMLGRLGWVYFRSNKLYDMQLPWAKVFTACGVAVAVFFTARLLQPSSLLHSLILKLLLSIGFCAVCLMLSEKTDRQLAFKRITRWKSA